MRLFFRKQQRIKQQKKIALLFAKGKRFRKNGILCYYLPHAGLPKHQVLISVGKKMIKKATQRNKLKRRMREAYRQQQHKITVPSLASTYLIAFLFVGKQTSDGRYTAIYDAIKASMDDMLTIRPNPPKA